MAFNSRYIAYAKTQGRSVEEQFAIDKENSMVDFISWIYEKKVEFANLFPEEFQFVADVVKAAYEHPDAEVVADR